MHARTRLAKPGRRRLQLVSLLLGSLGCSDHASEAADAALGVEQARAPEAAADGGGEVQAREPSTPRERDAGAAPSAIAGARTPQAGSPARDKPTTLAKGQRAITLRFRAQLGHDPFACGRTYEAQGSSQQSITPRDLRLFVQDVALLSKQGKEVPVQLDEREPFQTSEVALLDFEDASGECFGDSRTNQEITGVIPDGEYSALRFSNGVPDKLNHADPKTFPAPLRTPGMSWNWLLGLRFVKLETATQSAQTDADGGAGLASLELHIGSVGCAGNQNAGTIRCAKPNRNRVQLDHFDPDKSVIVLDVSAILKDSDLAEPIECHSAVDACEPMFRALGVSYATGQPELAQRAYRLE